MKPRRLPHIEAGTRFHRLVVIGNTILPNGRKAYVCTCDCGNEKLYEGSPLLSGEYRSCGCYRKEQRQKGQPTHGLCVKDGKITPEWSSWSRMRNRCYNENHDKYECYGGRGIQVCDRWRDSFENFLEDMGPKPTPKHTIERKNVNGNYEPSNCIWATQKIQTRNKRNTKWVVYDDRKMSLAEAIELSGSDNRLVRLRMKRGWSLEKAINEPVRLDVRHTGIHGHV